MARTGLYLSDVRKARDALLAQGRHPSVDAVRVALGNTGSKTTIHKYLKELDAEDGGAGGRKASISEALQDLVERLAARLQEEADERVVAIEAVSAEQARQHAGSVRDLEQQLLAVKDQLRLARGDVEREEHGHAQTRARLESETILRHTAEQQVIDLKERLDENEAHRRSLDEKHSHAREGMEHYRQSVKDQRDQDQRRHEQQVQQLQAEVRQQQLTLVGKQDDVTRLNQEGARLVLELSHTKQSLYEQLSRGRKLEQNIEQLQSIQRHADDLDRQLASKIAELELLAERFKEVETQLAPANARTRELELQLAKANARALAQEQIGEQLRVYLDKIAAGPATATAPES